MRIILTLVFLWISTASFGQAKDSIPILITDLNVQIEATEGINAMYNFEFQRADSQFEWLKMNYGWHPLPYFMLGLSQWWRIVPDINNKSHDEKMIAYMDTSLLYAERLFEAGSEVESSFFISAAWAFKGRLHAERMEWRKAALAGKQALKYLDNCRGNEEFGAEILLGDGLYNYYSVWIPEHYPILKPMMLLFRDGDKELGIKQLKEVSFNAFFTRTEAQCFLMKILAGEKNHSEEAMFFAEYLHQTFPNNPYFHRYYARMLYYQGKRSKLMKESRSILQKIDSLLIGYGPNEGRYASYFLAEQLFFMNEKEEAKQYYTTSIAFGKEAKAEKMGYHIRSLLRLVMIAKENNDKEEAILRFKEVKSLTNRKDNPFKKATQLLKEIRKKRLSPTKTQKP